MPRPEGHQPLPPHAQKVFEGVVFDVYQWEQELFDGTTATFERAKRVTDGVSVCSVLENGNVLLLTQEQPGRAPYTSVVGGMIDPGETPEETAIRELREEVGSEVRELVPWYAFQPVTKVDYAVYVFIARGCTRKYEQALDGGERISVTELTFEAFLDATLADNFLHTDISLRVARARADMSLMEELKHAFGQT